MSVVKFLTTSSFKLSHVTGRPRDVPYSAAYFAFIPFPGARTLTVRSFLNILIGLIDRTFTAIHCQKAATIVFAFISFRATKITNPCFLWD